MSGLYSVPVIGPACLRGMGDTLSILRECTGEIRR